MWSFAWEQLYTQLFPPRPPFFDVINHSQSLLATVVQRRWESSKKNGAGTEEEQDIGGLLDRRCSRPLSGLLLKYRDWGLRTLYARHTSTAARQSIDRVTLPTVSSPANETLLSKAVQLPRNGEALRHQNHKDPILAAFTAIVIAALHTERIHCNRPAYL